LIARHRVFDSTKFVAGAVNKNGKVKIFYEKKDMWEYILKLGKSENKRNKTLTIYGHNHEYDFYAYADMTDPNVRIFNRDPFIASYISDVEQVKEFPNYQKYEDWKRANEFFHNKIEILKVDDDDKSRVVVTYKTMIKIYPTQYNVFKKASGIIPKKPVTEYLVTYTNARAKMKTMTPINLFLNMRLYDKIHRISLSF